MHLAWCTGIWTKCWKMYINLKKCKAMSFSKAHCYMKFEYYVDGQSLTRVDSMIDLVVTLTTRMTSKNHILKMVSKAQCMSGLVKPTLGFNAHVAIKLQLYLSHVRSLLEYSTPLWSPYQVNEIMGIQRVQRHVTKCILNEYSSDVSYRDIYRYTATVLPQWQFLDLCSLFKCLHGEIDINNYTYPQSVKSNTSGHLPTKEHYFI